MRDSSVQKVRNVTDELSVDVHPQKYGSGSSTRSLLQSEIFRTQKRRMTWILFAVLAIVAALFYGGFTIAHFVNPDDQEYIDALKPSEFMENGFGLMILFASIIVVVFSSSLVGSEFSWNTMRPLVARSRTRSSMLSAKWITTAGMTLILAFAAVVLTLAAATIATLIIGEGFGLTSSVLVDGVAGTGRLFMATAPYAALAMMLAVVTRSNTAGIALGIGLQLLEPILFGVLGLLTDAFDTIAKGGIDYNVDRVTSIGADGTTTYTTQETLTSAAVLGVWIVAFVVISYVIFKRRDIVSG